MRILITTDWYKPVINGVVTSVINLMEGLERDGHEVRVLTLSNRNHSYRDGNVYYISSLGAGMVYPNARVMLPHGHKYIDELMDWKPDVIHSQCEFSTFVMARKIAKQSLGQEDGSGFFKAHCITDQSHSCAICENF